MIEGTDDDVDVCHLEQAFSYWLNDAKEPASSLSKTNLFSVLSISLGKTWILSIFPLFFQLAIREEISNMSIEEILQLKEKIGSKLFDKGLGLSKPKLGKPDDKYKRSHKNKPRIEPVGRKPVKKKMDHIVGVKACHKREIRDPRFDPMCGDFDDALFKQSYKFVDDIKSKELIELKKQLKSEEDPEQVEQLKYLIQRMENQAREKKKVEKEKAAKNEERKKNKELAKEGKAPVYVSKSERKKKDLLDKFEELKSTGKIDSYLKKKAKKNEAKERKNMAKFK